MGDLAEVKSLAVSESAQGKGSGMQLVQACLDEARALGVPKSLRRSPTCPILSERAGFHRVDKGTLPHKIWSECINCPKFPDCGEEAVEIQL